MHVAAALGRPQVALHGPTDPAKWGPLNPAAVVVRSTCPGCPSQDMGWEYHRTDGFCMEQVGVDPVHAAARALLDGVGAVC
jgi:ADP-heptose:LPS heptosyltransferase